MKYYIIAGEASGDLHGSKLIEEIKNSDTNSEFRLWGGELMSKAGGLVVKSLDELAFMGFYEVLINFFTAGMPETHALKVHLVESVPYFRFLMMGLGLLFIMRYRPKGILPEKIEI